MVQPASAIATDRATPQGWGQAMATPAVEFGPVALPVIAGALPAGLRGHLYRNGPARLQLGGQSVGHWFDGDGAVLGVHFDGTQATATYRYVCTSGYEAESEAGRYLYSGYGSLAPGPLWQRWQSQIKNAANTSVLATPERLLALWEGGLPHRLDPHTLDTLGLDRLVGDAEQLGNGDPFSAHPKRHPRTGHWFNFGLVPGANATLNLYRCSPQGRLEQRGEVPLNGIPLIHDFVLADRYLVFCVPPLRLNPLPAVLGFCSFSDALQWQPRRGTQLVVVDADSFEVVGWNRVDPWFQWHFGQAHLDSDGFIQLEVVAYPDFATNRQLQEIGAQQQIHTPAEGRLRRLRLNPHTAEIVEDVLLVDRPCEFPTSLPVEPGAVATNPTYLNLHREQPARPGEMFQAIGCYHSATGDLTVADAGEHCYPSEPRPVFDRHHSGQVWVLTVVYDAVAQASALWIYDGYNLHESPICKLALPQVVPPSFHGTWQGA